MLLTAALATFALGQTWVVEPVDSSNFTEECRVLALSETETHVVYSCDYSELRHAYRSGSTWRCEIVDSARYPYQSPYPSRVRLDRADRPSFVYTRQLGTQRDTWQLLAASYDGSAWQFTLVDSGPWFRNAIFSSLAPSYGVNGAGLGVVAYARVKSESTYEIRVAERVGDTWTKETIWSRTEHGTWFYLPTPVLAVGPAGRISVWLGVPDEGPTDTGLLLLASRTSGTWQWDTVGRLWMSGYDPYAAEIDSAGRDHLVYTSDWQLCYRVGKPDSWTVELVRRPFGRGEEAADLAFIGDVPHIAASSTMDPLYNSVRSPPGWTHETIPSQGGIGPSFSQDAAGTLYACFVEDLRFLRLARRTVNPVIKECVQDRHSIVEFRAVPTQASKQVTFRFALRRERSIVLGLCDAAGRQVTTLFSGKAPVGLNEAVWNCRDHLGRKMPAGIYFATLQTQDERLSRKVILTESD